MVVRLLGIDFGEKRIGLAISDPGGEFALPLHTIARRSDRSAIDAIGEIARQRQIDELVLGEPIRLSGERGPAAARVRRFGRRLESTTGLPIVFVNESLTTVEAAERLRAGGVDPRKSPEHLDALAAQILLQEELDRRRREDGA